MSITIFINGEAEQCEAETSVYQLISTLGFQNKKIAVELNEHIISASVFQKTYLQENDKLEIVHAIGGG
jgi:thiamine biosynthesis protein ThiS